MSFLRSARKNARSYDLCAFSVLIDQDAPRHGGGTAYASTSVVYLDQGVAVEAAFSRSARSKLSRAHKAGGVAQPASSDPEPFIRLYEQSSRTWRTTYPFNVLRRLAATGLLRLHHVELDGAVESSMAVVCGERHWMYWLGAQSDAGRAAELGYVAMAALLAEAHAAGKAAVNLGASSGLPGVARFKKQFGAVEVPVVEHRSSLRLPLAAQSAANASLTWMRTMRRPTR
jgi:hypothetical protein